MDDFELLQAYASQRREDAFSTLTGRYLNLVYSAAARQTSSPQAAEDVTQTVFLTLARKAGTISRHTVLAGWLLRTTRYATANARRLEQRRQHYEQQAMQIHLCPTESQAAWPRIAPLLDEALDRLTEKDRAAIALRFLEQKSLRQVAEQLNLTEDGAQKRVARALEKLRAFFTRRGKTVTLSAAAFSAALAAHGVQAAPATLAASIAAAVASPATLAGSTLAAITEATLQTLAQSRFQMFAVRIASILVLVGIGGATFVRLTQEKPPNPTTAVAPPAAAAPTQTASPPNIAAPPAFAAAALAAPTNLRELSLRVADAQSGAPVTNARLTAVIGNAGPGRVTNILFTDLQGTRRVAYSAEPVRSWSLRIEIFRDGYVPKYLSWSESQQDQIDEIPDQYTVKVDPAVTIGGVVVDEQELPISNLRVVFSVSGPTASQARERVTMMGNYHTEITDARGRWSCSHVPARFGMIDYRLVHPEYQERSYSADSADASSSSKADRLAEADLLAGRAILRAQRGLVLAGTVTDDAGQPVAGAKITQGYDFRSAERTTLTDAGGLFRFGNGRPRELALTIEAAGLAPVVTSLVVSASMENLHFTLPPGKLLLGRIVDEAGKPVTSATVEAASPSSDSRTLFEWHTKTDGEGRFSWDAAPGAQDYAIYATGFESQERTTLTADGTEAVITLKKKSSFGAVRILGEVLDAETKTAPTGVRVQIWQTTKEPSGGWSSFTTRAEDVAPNGKFRLKTSSSTLGYVLEVQADGYWPERLTNQVTGQPEVRLTIELKKAPAFGGVILNAAGEPAPGATIVVCGPRDWAQMNTPGKLQLGARNNVAGTVSAADGRFRLPPKHAPEFVLAAHDQGFAEIPFGEMGSNTVITLQPWGRIEGTLTLAGQRRADETISLGGMSWRYASDYSRLSLFITTKTDANGHYVFDTVPPGERKVSWRPGFRDGKVGVIPLSHGIPVSVAPGASAQANLGGSGRPLTGKIVVSGREKRIDWQQDVHSLTSKLDAPPDPIFPKPTDFSSQEEYAAAAERIAAQIKPFWNSDQGKAQQWAQRSYVPIFSGDGLFRIDDVVPGTYMLKIWLNEPSKTGNIFDPVAPIGKLEMEVTVPESSEGSPLELGTLPVTPAGKDQANSGVLK